MLASIALSALGSAVSAKPNFIFVLADDWGWGDVGVYKTLLHGGIQAPATPNLDKLAHEGIVFTDFHTLGAECSPSRASFMTGRSPSDDKVRIHLVISDKHEQNVEKCACADFLNTSVPTVTSVMKDAGYSVGHFGKWHLGGTPDAPSPEHYGIDESKTYVSNPLPGRAYKTGDEWFSANSSRLIVDDGMAFVSESLKNKPLVPFYLNLWFHISHAPLHPTEEQLTANNGTFSLKNCPGPNPGHAQTQCAIQVYRALQFEADSQIGRLVTVHWLDTTEDPSSNGGKLSGNTLLVFSTGSPGAITPSVAALSKAMQCHRNMLGDPGPFRGRKRSLYEGGIRVPFIARWPGRVPAGVVSGADFMSADWLPTVAALARVSLPKLTSDGLMGRDASALFQKPSHSPPPRTTPRMWDYRFDLTGGQACWLGAPRLAIRDPQNPSLKLLMNVAPAPHRVELYNLSASTYEADEITSDPAMAPTVERLRATLAAWAKTLGPTGGNTANARHMGCREYAVPTSGLLNDIKPKAGFANGFVPGEFD